MKRKIASLIKSMDGLTADLSGQPDTDIKRLAMEAQHRLLSIQNAILKGEAARAKA